MTTPTLSLPLLCHPATPCPLALNLSVTLDWQIDGLVLRYEVTGQVDGIRLPPTAPPGPADGLWQHTCLEAFVSPVLAAHYRELNFSPSQQWAAYCFSAERQRDVDAETCRPAQPDIQITHRPQRLELRATLPEAALPPGPRLCLGLSAVIETQGGHLSYWALQHPRAERPDFHHRGGWRELPRLAPTA
ncbi:MAG: DOMON-like domain-containing protein [Hydrogenophaga sp.]|nr:DOMON-like domain-containing protein [Hydrogenophaga sp.]